MITAQEILARAYALLEYDGDNGGGGYRPQAGHRQELAACNQIYGDLWYMEHQDGVFSELTALHQPVLLSARTLIDVMPYGVAMLLSQMAGDGTKQALYASLYSQKRGSVSAPPARRVDVLPRGMI